VKFPSIYIFYSHLFYTLNKFSFYLFKFTLINCCNLCLKFSKTFLQIFFCMYILLYIHYESQMVTFIQLFNINLFDTFSTISIIIYLISRIVSMTVILGSQICNSLWLISQSVAVFQKCSLILHFSIWIPLKLIGVFFNLLFY